MRHLGIVIGACLVSALGACGGGPAIYSDGTTSLAMAEWKDVSPALIIALDRSQLNVVNTTRSEDGLSVTFELLGVHDEPGKLTLTRKAPGLAEKGEGPIPIEITATIGRFGDRDRERQLIADFRRRLGDLAGVDVAPLR